MKTHVIIAIETLSPQLNYYIH